MTQELSQYILDRFHGYQVDERVLRNAVEDWATEYFGSRAKAQTALKLIEQHSLETRIKLDQRQFEPQIGVL